MELEVYLEGIRACPDEFVQLAGRKIHRLTEEFGVYDNLFMLWGAEPNEVCALLEKGPFEVMLPSVWGDSKENRDILYKPGTIKGFLYRLTTATPGALTYGYEVAAQAHIERQKKAFLNKTFLTLHPYYEERKIPGMHDERALAHAVSDMAEIAMANKISLCLSHTIGWKYIDDDTRFERIPYYLA